MIAATHGLGRIRRPDGFVSLTCTCVLSLLYYPYLCCTTLVLESSVGLTLVAIEKKSVEIKSYSKTTVYSEDIQKDRDRDMRESRLEYMHSYLNYGTSRSLAA